MSVLQSPGAPAPCQARLAIQQQNGLLTVTSYCRNLLPTNGRYRYELRMTRESSGGHSQNQQGGEFSVEAQQEVSLSQASINTGPQDSYSIKLRVFDLNGHTVAQDSALQVPKH